MKLQVKNGCEDELGCSEWVNFFAQAEEVCSVRVTNRRKDKFFGRDLSGVAVVRLDDAAELGFTSNASSELGSKGLVENLVTHSDPSMRTDGVVVPDPCPDDVMQLLLTETHEVVEAFVLECTDERFDEGICLGRSDGRPDGLHALLEPEVTETIREFSVAVPEQESRLDTLVLHPHRRVAGLLHDPVPVGRIGRRASVDLPAPEVDENENIRMEYAPKGVDLLTKEITRHNRVDVGMHKCRPLHRRILVGLVRPRAEPRVGEDLPDSGRPDTASEFLEFSDNTAVSPEDRMVKIFSLHSRPQLCWR